MIYLSRLRWNRRRQSIWPPWILIGLPYSDTSPLMTRHNEDPSFFRGSILVNSGSIWSNPVEYAFSPYRETTYGCLYDLVCA